MISGKDCDMVVSLVLREFVCRMLQGVTMNEYTPLDHEAVWEDNYDYKPVTVDFLQAVLHKCDQHSLVGIDEGGNFGSIIHNIYTIQNIVVLEPLLLYTDQCAWAKESTTIWVNEGREVLTVEKLQLYLSLASSTNNVSVNPNDTNGRPMGVYKRDGSTFIKVGE